MMDKQKLKPGWRIVKFGDVVHLNTDRIADPVSSGIERFVGLEHITPEDLHIQSWGLVEDGITFTNHFKPGQVLFGKRRAYQRKVAVADFEGVCSSDIYVFEPKDPNILLPDLLPFICQTKGFFEHAVGTSAGSLSPRTNWSQLARYEFALPPLEEQRKLVELLSGFETMFSEYKNAIEKHEVLYKSLAQDLLSAKDSINKIAKFDEMNIQIIDGDRGKAYPARNQLHITGYCLFLNAKNVTQAGFEFSECEFISQERDSLLKKGNLIRGDIVLTTRGTLGNVAHYDASVPYKNMRLNSGMLIFRCDNSRVYARYLYWLFRSPFFQNQIDRFRSGSAQPQLPIKLLNRFSLPYPDLSEQKRISSIFDSWDCTRQTLSSQLQNTNELFRKFLSHSFDYLW
jgi:type I restriction enzyme, S subunit